MRKLIIFVVVVVIVLTVWGKKEEFREDLTGENYYVCYNAVNIRSKPTTNSEKVGETYLGCPVTLTGKVVIYRFNDIYSQWYETTKGWIASDALMAEEFYNEIFYWN